MKYYLTLYITTLLVMGAFDAIWLGAIAKDFYRSHLGDQFEFHRIPAFIFYFMYAGGVVLFVSGSPFATSWQQVLLYGALLGLLCFATYDLTNLATLRGWSVKMSIVDIAWGIFNTGASATIGWLITRALVK